MISKAKYLKNIGKFYDFSCKANELDWHRNTFVFAPNAYGKSTLVNVFRSLCGNDPKIIKAHKTLTASAPPEAVIVIGGENYVFNGSIWSKHCSAIQIFDTTYIHENILTHEIAHEHKKNIHRIIIGAQGITLAQELAVLKSNEKEERNQLEILAGKFRLGGFAYFTLEAFLNISTTEEAAVAQRIKKLEQDIKSKESETLVRALSTPNPLSDLSFDFPGLKALVTQKVAAIHGEAEKLVLAHIDRNIKDKTLAKEFIRQGLDLAQADCPFCGQDLKNAVDLLTAYRQYFDDAFRTYQQKLALQSGVLANWNLDNELTLLVSTHNANMALVKQWEPFIGAVTLPDIISVIESHRQSMDYLKIKAQAELEKKQKDPNMDVDLSHLEALISETSALNSAITAYNDAIAGFADKTKDFIENLPKSDVNSIRLELARRREVEMRFKPDWKQWAIKYQSVKTDADNLLIQKNTKQKELEDYTKAIFATYQKRINELLVTLGADFTIVDLTGKTDDRANEAYSDFSFLILEKKIPLTARQDDLPSFKNTLSEGDKGTLSFAFFIAALEKMPELDKQIVIFDDPLSSLDENRREATARILMDLSPKLCQLCVFTHKKDFLGMLFDKMSDNKVLQIKSDKKHGSRLELFDVEEDRKAEVARLVDDMERYLTEDFGPTTEMMQGNIRRVFEIVLKTKYYRTLAADIKNKKGLAKLLETLFEKELIDTTLKSNLFNLCNLSAGPHHGDIVDLPERKLSRDELLPLISKALDLLEKV